MLYDYVEHGGTAESARQLGVDEHAVVKTLVMQDERGQPLIVLMHGDRQVSTKNLAREIGAKSVQPCQPDVAQRHSGYIVGGTSPFGFTPRGQCAVYVQRQRCSSCRASTSTAGGAASWSASTRPCCQGRWVRRRWTAP
jgi:Cys-tRNA(Pro) deacylase